MKLLLLFNLAALAFVVVTNGGYVPEIVEGQDPYCEYGIIFGVFACIAFNGWLAYRKLKKDYDEDCGMGFSYLDVYRDPAGKTWLDVTDKGDYREITIEFTGYHLGDDEQPVLVPNGFVRK